MKFYFVLIIAFFVLVGCQANQAVDVLPTNTQPVCTAEAKVCPNGTVVGRTGPNCEFIPCPELPEEQADLAWQNIVAKDVTNAHSVYTFSAQIPADWRIESVPAVEALNIFNPKAVGLNNLEKSQIFIRYFQANTFLTLSTVTIYSKTGTKINNHPAVVYDIEKKSNLVNFADQPFWRSQRHSVTDIQVSDSNPSVFYVVAKRPGLAQEIFDQFLSSLNVNDNDSSIVFPVAEFKDRIIKKPFGIYITPETSPVQPERFSGYHTGVDVEYADIQTEVPVLAVAPGSVVFSGRVGGYGGVVVINHLIDGKNYLLLYGHLAPESLLSKNTVVSTGQQIGVLGQDGTSQTDGERKHLHLSVHTGSEINFLGYVQTQEDLNNWVDPLTLFP